MGKLTSLELWRLADTLSVINAAILVCGGDPSEDYWDNEGERVQQTHHHEGFEAAFNSLRQAILTNKLAANVKLALRGGRTSYDGGGQPYEVLVKHDEEQIGYDMLVFKMDAGARQTQESDTKVISNFSITSLSTEPKLYVCKEPNWEQTTVEVEDLKKWLDTRGVRPDFFFPSGYIEEFKNPQNPRYSAKLACAMAAWSAVRCSVNNKSVKQTLHDWVRSNGVNYGIGEDSVVSQTAADEIAKIANWDTKGGANATPTSVEGNSANEVGGYGNSSGYGHVENYGYGHPEITSDD